MVVTQAAANPVTGVRPFPADFRLVAVYGDVALGTDHTDFKTARPDGTIPFTSDSHCLRVFVRQNGVWRLSGGWPRPRNSPDGVRISKRRAR